MGFAANIGIRQAKNPIVVLTNSDIYHVPSANTIQPVVEACSENLFAIGTLADVWDDDSRLINLLDSYPHAPNAIIQDRLDLIRTKPRLSGVYPANPDVPFFMSFPRDILLKIGGYDEDFIGCASEDCDLLDRFKSLGYHFHYAPKGSEAFHLYHGRRTIKELKQDPGFQHNIALRNERSTQIVRNRDRPWGNLHNPNAPWDAAPIHMVLWVTSKCNLACRYCNQKTVMSLDPEYDMCVDELHHFLTSCKDRGIRFSTLELTGGEPSLWSNFYTGLEAIHDAGIADKVTFITNGNDAERVALAATFYHMRYTVSYNQATPKQREIHTDLGVGVQWNKTKHVDPLTFKASSQSLPTDCNQRTDMDGQVVRQLVYYKGGIYYCCMSLSLKHRTLSNVQPYAFDLDFDKRYKERRPSLSMCQICMCNRKAWEHRLEQVQ
jgi:organic radical activating enzyme